MSVRWKDDAAFVSGARLLWPEDVRLATAWSPERGRTEANRVMANRYEGWMLLRKLASLSKACDQAAENLREGSRHTVDRWPT